MLRRTVGLAFAMSLSSTIMASAAEPLVDAEWLAAHLDQPDIVVLDVRDVEDGDANALFAAGHVPGAVHSDYVKAGWRTTINGVAGMLPPVADVERLIESLGIDNDDHVVIVSHGKTSSDFGAATRVFWTFDVMGHDETSILEGGYAGWVAAGKTVETTPGHAPEPSIFNAHYRPSRVASLDDVKAAQRDGTPLIDARPRGQYTGAAVPPNVGVAGTIPGAYSLPHDVLVQRGNDAIEEPELDALLAKLDLAPAGPAIAFCNTGHWASIGWFMLNKVGKNAAVTMYDGSMYEWAKVEGEPTVIGADRTVN